ncbi:MAG: helix-turn-helix domain-containing protein [Flammeovirgaceae bacterium]|nr:helix-turn-helix domain-containing protein [Flammeovirgaceae bacterium]
MKKKSSLNESNIKLIFGLKLKQLRLEKNLSFQALADAAGVSVSYLNEIEKGKKYPKAEKIASLADALDVSYDWLVSVQMGKQLAPIAKLLQSKLVNELPLDFFGIDKSQLFELLSGAPVKLNAFINTMIEIGRNYGMRVEDLYFSTLRSYQEMHDNYFEEIEQSVESFVKQHQLDPSKPISADSLVKILEEQYQYIIVEDGLSNQPELQELRSVLIPDKQPRLLLNKNLSRTQRAFILGREAGFRFMDIENRSNTTSWVSFDSFDEVVNNFKGSYFSCSLFLNRQNLIEWLKEVLSAKSFNVESFQELMDRYVVSPEILLHRLTNILPRYFGINELFFLRFSTQLDSDKYEITKEMHLSGLHNPHSNMLNEHYCRRWVSIDILKDLFREVKAGTYTQSLCRVQRSKYIGTDKEYLIISFAKPIVFGSEKHNSVSIGLLINDQLKKKVKFWNDPQIPIRMVGETCERCVATDCKERVEKPLFVTQQQRVENMKVALGALMD